MRELAEKSGTTLGYLRLLLSGARKPSHTLAKAIQAATNNQVTKEAMRPDIYGLDENEAMQEMHSNSITENDVQDAQV